MGFTLNMIKQSENIEPNILIREIKKDDLGKVANVHINAFPESALTKLGLEVVKRYYLWQLTGPHKKVRATGAFIDNDCVGFSFSGEFNGSVSGFLNQNKTFLFKEVIIHPWLVFNSLFLKRLLLGLKLLKKFNKKKKRKVEKKKERPNTCGILSIAVSKNHQKLGIGKRLMNDAEKEAIKYGYERIGLTVNPDNKNAVSFYEKLNWKKTQSDDLWNGSMTKALNKS